MHTGKIKKLVLEKGFGFITDSDGTDVFFHKNNLVGITFESLTGGEEVTFEVEQNPKGKRAVNVSLASK
ncbi:MAG: cold shock domain-containing protein [Candidatus Omnitrophica bacterium]|nr:cold shock domain-containing protein [Candidatus Omnitrophota bacterium]